MSASSVEKHFLRQHSFYHGECRGGQLAAQLLGLRRKRAQLQRRLATYKEPRRVAQVACPLPAYSRESVYEGRIALMRACQTERRTHDRYCLQSPKGEFTRSPVHRWRFTLIFRLPGYGHHVRDKGGPSRAAGPRHAQKLGGEGGHWGSFSYCRYPCRLHGQRLGEI